MSLAENEHLYKLIHNCLKGKRASQKLLYEEYFGYSFSICIRYSKSKEEAYEILNDGFLKVFTKLKMYNPEKPFKGWLRRILINTALDHYRKNLKHYYHDDLESGDKIAISPNVVQDMAYEEIIKMIQELPPSYRMVFNLAVIDGYKHEEIAEILGISVGTSKSNLYKAREKLKIMFMKSEQENYAKFFR